MSTFHKYRNQYNSNNHYQSNKRTYEHDYAGHQSKSFRGQNQGVYLDHKLRASCFKECTKWRISIKSGVNDCVATQKINGEGFLLLHHPKTLYSQFEIVDKVAEVNSMTKKNIEDKLTSKEQGEGLGNMNDLQMPINYNFFDNDQVFFLSFGVDSKAGDEETADSGSLFSLKGENYQKLDYGISLNGFIHESKVFSQDYRINISGSTLMASIKRRLEQYYIEFLVKQKHLRESNPGFDIENFKFKFFCRLEGELSQVAFEFSIPSNINLLKLDFNEKPLAQVGIKILKMYVEIRYLSSEPHSVAPTVKLQHKTSSKEIDEKQLNIVKSKSIQPYITTPTHQTKRDLSSSINQLNSFRLDSVWPGPDFERLISDYYGSSCNFYVFNTQSTIFLDPTSITSDTAFQDIFMGLNKVSSYGLEIDYQFQGKTHSVNYSPTLSLLKLVLDLKQNELYKSVIEELNLDSGISFKDSNYSNGYYYFLFKSGLVVHIQNGVVMINYSETRPSYSRRSLISELADVIPKCISKLSNDLIKPLSYIGILWVSNDFEVSTSFIKYYQLQLDLTFSSKQIVNVGILPIRFDKKFFLSKLSFPLDPRRIMDFTFSLQSSISMVIEQVFGGNMTFSSIDYENYLKSQFMIFEM